MNIFQQLYIPMFLKDANVSSLISVLFTIIATVFLNTLLRSLIKVPKKLDTRRGRTYVSVTRSIITIVLAGVALNIIFIILNINIAPLLASAGIVGLTIGIGARSLVEDLIAGFFLLSQDSIAIGDYVMVSGNYEGTVDDIGFRTLKIRGINGALNIIPNGQVKQVVNFTRGRAIINVDLPVKTGQKVDEIYTILTKILTQMSEDSSSEFHVYPESSVFGIQNIQAGSAMVIRVTLITTAGSRGLADKEFRYMVIKAFEKHKIQFA